MRSSKQNSKTITQHNVINKAKHSRYEIKCCVKTVRKFQAKSDFYNTSSSHVMNSNVIN